MHRIENKPEASHSVCHWHSDDKGEEVIDEGVEGLVHEGPPENTTKLVFVLMPVLFSTYSGRFLYCRRLSYNKYISLL